MNWWFNELGEPLHLKFGAVGRYVVQQGRHWLRCHDCTGSSLRVNAPSLAYWHAMYGRTS